MKTTATNQLDFITFLLSSVHANYTYTIQVYIPETEPPETGFPIHYVLDGLFYFGLVKDIVRLQSRNTPKTNVAPAIVVGIGHDKPSMKKRRFYDFTAPAERLIPPDHAKDLKIDQYGGAEAFSQFIELELKPFIKDKLALPINPEQQTLYGHSLGGYFTLWSLFTRPQNFQNYLAISPSTWWNGEEIFHYANEFIQQVTRTDVKKIFIAVGEKEGFMVDGAKRLYDLLNGNRFPTGLYIAPEENHASVVPTTLSRALRYLF
jgi:predicted alpha/beta superfamily hydrolase